MEGEALQELGKAGQNFYLNSLEFDKQRKNAQNKVEFDEAETLWREHLQESKFQAEDQLAKNPASDGVDVIKSIRESNKATMDDLASRISDPIVARSFKAKAGEWQLGLTSELGSMQRKRSVELIGRKINETKTVSLKQISGNSDPLARQIKIAELSNMISQQDDSVINPMIKEQNLMNIPREVDTSIVEGLFEKRKFVEARNFYMRPDVAKNYSPEELQKKMDDVQESAYKLLTRDRNLEELARQDLERKREASSRLILGTSLTKLFDDRVSPAEKKQLMDTVEIQYASGAMTETHYKLFNNSGNRVTKEISDPTALRFMNRIIEKKGLDTINADIIRATDKDVATLDPAAAMSLLRAVKAAKEKDVHDPMVTLYKNRVLKSFGVDEFEFGPDKARRELDASAAVTQYGDLVFNQGKSPAQAFNIVISGNYKSAKNYAADKNIPKELVNNPDMYDAIVLSRLNAHALATKAGDAAAAARLSGEIRALKNWKKKLLMDTQREDDLKRYPPSTQAPKTEEMGYFDKFKKSIQEFMGTNKKVDEK
jgi:hypothetical protein